MQTVTIRNDVQQIDGDISQLKKGDHIRVCYRHTVAKVREAEIGDHCYIVGYVVDVRNSKVTLSNVNPKYSHHRLPMGLKRRVRLKDEQILELEKFIKD